jgi:hypothetical protein
VIAAGIAFPPHIPPIASPVIMMPMETLALDYRRAGVTSTPWTYERRRQYAGMAVGACLVAAGALAALLEALLVLLTEWEWGMGRCLLEAAVAFLPSLGVVWLVLSRPGREERMGAGIACLIPANVRVLLILTQIVVQALKAFPAHLGIWIYFLDWPFTDESLQTTYDGAQIALSWADLALVIATWVFVRHFAARQRMRLLGFLATAYLALAGLTQMFLALSAGVLVLPLVGLGDLLPPGTPEHLAPPILVAETARAALTLALWIVLAVLAWRCRGEIDRDLALSETDDAPPRR